MLENIEETTSQSSFETSTPGYSVSTSKALRILLTHKIRDPRFQRLLAQWACTLLAFIAVCTSAFFLIPTFWVVGASVAAIFLFALIISIGTGDLFLQFALEDKGFLEMATKSNALNVFEDEDRSLEAAGTRMDPAIALPKATLVDGADQKRHQPAKDHAERWREKANINDLTPDRLANLCK